MANFVWFFDFFYGKIKQAKEEVNSILVLKKVIIIKEDKFYDS